MEQIGTFLGRLALAILFSVFAGLLHLLPPVVLVFYCFGTLFLGISGDLMEDCGGLARMILFYLAMGMLLIPSLVLNIVVFCTKEGTYIQSLFFLACTAGVFTTWIMVGKNDLTYIVLDGGIPYYILAVAIILYMAEASVVVMTTVSTVISGILLLIQLIIFLKNGSAMY